MRPTRSHDGASDRATCVARRHAIAAALLLLTAQWALGCGDNLHVAVPDAAVDVAPPPDDAPVQADASATACEVEFKRCEDAGATFCTDYGLECVPVRVDTQASVCLRRCQDTAGCPFNSYCVPSKVQWGGLTLAAHHCFGSVCGGTYGNGQLFGACSVGGDNLVSLDAGQQRPGTCIPIDTDAGTGVCAESGNDYTAATAGRGQSCTLDMQAAGCPPRGDVLGCVAGTTCVGPACQALGTCALLCDPRLDPEGQCTVGTGSTKEYCLDSSLFTLGASGILHVGYFGFCQPQRRCRLFAPLEDGGAPAPGCTADDGCYPTTMVTANGVCAPAGSLAAGAPCEYLNDCAAGLACVGTDACGAGTCRAVCPLPDGGSACGAGETCQGVAMDPSQPTVVSAPWGVCLDGNAKKRARQPLRLVRPLARARR